MIEEEIKPSSPIWDHIKKREPKLPDAAEEEGDEPDEEEEERGKASATLRVTLPTITIELTVEDRKSSKELLNELKETFREILRDSRVVR